MPLVSVPVRPSVCLFVFLPVCEGKTTSRNCSTQLVSCLSGDVAVASCDSILFSPSSSFFFLWASAPCTAAASQDAARTPPAPSRPPKQPAVPVTWLTVAAQLFDHCHLCVFSLQSHMVLMAWPRPPLLRALPRAGDGSAGAVGLRLMRHFGPVVCNFISPFPVCGDGREDEREGG